MRFLHSLTIRRQVTYATLAVLVPFLAVASWSFTHTWSERQDEVYGEARSVSATAAAYFQQYLTGLDSVALSLARHPAIIALDRAQCDALLAETLRGQQMLLNIMLTDPAGLVKGTAVPPRMPVEPAVNGAYVKDVVASGKVVVSELMTGQMSGRPTVVIAYPVRDAGQTVVGVLGFGLDLLSMEALFNRIPLPPGSVITLSDSQSRVMSRSIDAAHHIGRQLTTNPTPLRQVPPAQVATSADGVQRFYGNSVVDRGPWLLSVGIPVNEAFLRARPLFLRNIAIVALSTAGVLSMSFWLSGLMARGLDRVRYAAERIASGDLSPPAPVAAPNLEIARLVTAFETMASNLREARAALDRQIEQERRTREMLESLQRQVVRQERLAAVGILVSGVAHELNNPLQAVLGAAELLERRKELTPEVIDEIVFVKTQSLRAKEIIRNLSRFSNQHTGEPTLVDLRDVIAEIAQLRRRDLDRSDIALEVETVSTRRVFATVTELEQVTLNFVINAQQSIEGDGRTQGRIRIRLDDAGRRVRLEVQDDGPGVPPQHERQLFQPFFTTKPVGKGTGLGLSVSYGIIESYGGTVGYRRNDWGGATFFFELPAAESADDRPPVLPRPVSSNV